MSYIRNHLAVKLFLSFMVAILIGVFILLVSTRLSLPAAYNRHMGGMQGMRQGMGPMMTGVGQQDVYGTFRSSFYEALAYAGVAAVLTALAASAIISRRIVAPLNQMMVVSQRISEGHYNERIKVNGSDELGQLSEHFNQMTSELEKVETRRKQLIGDVSHELRTPLTSIKASMEGLIDGVLPPSQDLFVQIHQETDRLSRLVDDLQELSRVESGAVSLQLNPVDLTDVVAVTIKRLKSEIDRKNHELVIDVDTCPQVIADQDRLVQVLMNLVSNAINYTPDNGKIKIFASQSGEFAHVSVSDTGIGISKESLPFVFDRFYRVDKSRSRGAGGGSGIGLTVAKSLVEAHGGRIWVESDGEGMGSTFVFSLPIA